MTLAATNYTRNARAWRSGWRAAPFGILVLLLAGPAAAASDQYDDARWCSDWYTTHPDNSLSPAKHRRCIIAIASTYLDAEQNSIPPEDILFADDAVRRTIGSEPGPGGLDAEAIRQTIRDGQTAVIAAIANRQWTVDGGEAFVIYDGFLVFDPEVPGFFVAERISVEQGLITEVLIGGVQFP